MKDMCRENKPLTVNGMIEFIQDNCSEWLDDYINGIGLTAAPSLERLWRRFAYRHGFSKRTATKLQENVAVLAEKKYKYCAQFWGLYSNVNTENIFNVDETGTFSVICVLFNHINVLNICKHLLWHATIVHLPEKG